MYIKTTKRNAVYNYEKFENHVKLLVIAKCIYVYVYTCIMYSMKSYTKVQKRKKV